MDYYKKKYDEALERARKLKENPQSVFNEYSPKEGDTICDYIFPELKESEDEKIRKELIEHVKDQQSSFISAPDCRDKYEEEENDKYNSWLAWLEKQGEQKPTDKVEPKFKVGDRITKSSKKSCPVHSSIDDTICEVTEVHDTCYILNTKEGRIQEPFEWQDYYELVEPAWSKEDEVMIKVFDSIIRYIVEVVDKDALERFGTNREELFSWLKSLRSQSKQEWSEEDNWIKTKIIKVLLGCETFLTSEETNECIDWIKSIKQRLKGKS